MQLNTVEKLKQEFDVIRDTDEDEFFAETPEDIDDRNVLATLPWS